MATEWRNDVLSVEGESYTMVTNFDGTPMMSDGYFTFSRDCGKKLYVL